MIRVIAYFAVTILTISVTVAQIKSEEIVVNNNTIKTQIKNIWDHLDSIHHNNTVYTSNPSDFESPHVFDKPIEHEVLQFVSCCTCQK
mgnify:CR=1 FL=1